MFVPEEKENPLPFRLHFVATFHMRKTLASSNKVRTCSAELQIFDPLGRSWIGKSRI